MSSFRLETLNRSFITQFSNYTMQIKKALITAAGADQRKLSMQTLVDREGNRKTVLEILIEEIVLAGIDEIGLVIQPADLEVYKELIAGNHQIHFGSPRIIADCILEKKNMTRASKTIIRQAIGMTI